MYIANGADYQKFSAPNPTVNASKVGIAEPQDPCEAGPAAQNFVEILSPGNSWNTAGTASGWFSSNRSADTVVTAQFDPSSPFQEGSTHGATPPRWSVQVSPGQQYQVGEILYFTQTATVTTISTIIEQVIPPLSVPMTVQALYPTQTSFPSITVVVLQNITGPGKFKPVSNESGQALPTEEVIAQLQRGALIQIGTETTYVRSVTSGPDNQICVEVFLNNTHAVGEMVIGLPTIVVNGITDAAYMVPGTNIVGDGNNQAPGPGGPGFVQNFAVTTGVGTLTSGPPGGGPTGTIIARPTTFLNGWGPNAHVGAYELTVNQSFGWGLNPDTTRTYNNPGNAFDGNISTFASATETHGHHYYGCIWSFPVTPTGSSLVLNINSQVLSSAQLGGGTVQGDIKRSSGIWYSLDAGVTWIQIYNVGYVNVPNFNGRAQQWDSVPLPAGQIISNIQVMAFMDSHDDQGHYVYEINISQGAASIGINTGIYQVEDYLHFSVLVDQLQNLTELKLQFDISDGTFNSNYYYYSVRPSDLVPATQNTVTQLGAIQAVMQETQVNAQTLPLNLSISQPTVAGASQWSEIWTPISGLTRVGGDATKTLATINAVQILVNAANTINVAVSSIAFVGGGQPDVGDVGEPCRYRVIPYSSVTGAKGNPSPDMRYGVTARRQQVQVTIPSSVYLGGDAQIDTWLIYRWGGTITQWRWIGQTAAVPAGTTWQDNYDDAAASAGNPLEFDNFEPWPSVDVPFNNFALNLVGFYADVNVSPPGNVARFLPGNLVLIGGTTAFTLRKRPFLPFGTGTLYRFEFNECTAGIFAQGFGVNVPLQIYEPEISRQFLPYMWGPDANGVVFACGDPLRPGTLYGSKPYAPDSAPDSYNQEICPPSEPLLGGIIIDGLSYVASSERWWALYPQLDNPAQRYAPQQAPLVRGLLSPYGASTDGKEIFWWAGDGLWSSTKGSLIDEDLYTLFPHEGIVGAPAVYGTPPLGRTQNPPDYSRAGTFRLTYWNDYVYAVYQDSSGAYSNLIYDTRRDCWAVDQYAVPVSTFFQPFQPSGTLLTSTALYPEIIMGDTSGQVLQQQTLTNDNGTPISCLLARFEFDGGDNRAPKQWGDMFIDGRISAVAGLNATPMSLSAPVASGTVNIPAAPNRQRNSIGMGPNPVTSDFMGCLFSWTDDFLTQTTDTVLYIWSPSYSILPARLGGATASGGTGSGGFTTFGTSFTLPGYGHIGWVSLAYISNSPITMNITTYDGQSPQTVTLPSTGGQLQKTLFRVSANKGQLFRFAFSSPGQFQIFNDDSDIMVGAWERTGPYADVKTFEVPVVDSAPL
jgi:hypothetical protein